MCNAEVEMTEQDKLFFDVLKNHSSLPLPESFYRKYKLVPKQPDTFKESIENNYAFKCMLYNKYELGAVTVKTPDDYVFPKLSTELAESSLEVKSTDLEVKTK